MSTYRTYTGPSKRLHVISQGRDLEQTVAFVKPISLTLPVQSCTMLLSLKTGLIWRPGFLKIQCLLSAFRSSVWEMRALEAAVYLHYHLRSTTDLASEEWVLIPIPIFLSYLSSKENVEEYPSKKQGNVWSWYLNSLHTSNEPLRVRDGDLQDLE